MLLSLLTRINYVFFPGSNQRGAIYTAPAVPGHGTLATIGVPEQNSSALLGDTLSCIAVDTSGVSKPLAGWVTTGGGRRRRRFYQANKRHVYPGGTGYQARLFISLLSSKIDQAIHY